MTETPTRWRLVPETATEEMRAVLGNWPRVPVGAHLGAYCAMVARAPSPGEEMVERMAAVMWADTCGDKEPDQFAHADEWARRVYLSNARAILAMLTKGG